MVVLIWWRAPWWESCSSEFHWLVVSFQMAAMDPESLFLLHWFGGSICGLPHYCSQISMSTFFCPIQRCSASRKWRRRPVNRIQTDVLSIATLLLRDWSIFLSLPWCHLRDSRTSAALFLSLVMPNYDKFEPRAHGAMQSGKLYTRNPREAAQGTERIWKVTCFSDLWATKAKKKKKTKTL